ncbi:hypothetical protein ACQKRQ_02115 [Paraburkholderia sp. NPDC080076]|uniref:hypothetical protein n=1 Tax=Paraburkholderia sp. NPDC080076 TaxID=3390605 RepID=UPI003CFF8306
MKRVEKLNVEQKVRAAAYTRAADDPGVEMSVSELARVADVNRSGLYEHHHDLLDELLPHRRALRRGEKKQALHENPQKAQGRNLERENKALLYLCLELKLENRSLRSETESRSASRTRSRRRPKE